MFLLYLGLDKIKDASIVWHHTKYIVFKCIVKCIVSSFITNYHKQKFKTTYIYYFPSFGGLGGPTAEDLMRPQSRCGLEKCLLLAHPGCWQNLFLYSFLKTGILLAFS